MSKGTYFYANGKRKTAVATIRLYPQGQGDLTVNGLKLREWADDENMVHTILAPLEMIGKKKDRTKERKKPGLRKARKSAQWSKR